MKKQKILGFTSEMAAIICYWQYVEPENKYDPRRLWELVESYPIDGDGHPLIKPKNCKNRPERHEYNNWVSEKHYYDEAKGENGDWDFQPISGRAVTMWDTDNGVSLLEFNPPEDCHWLAPDFTNKLKKLHNWAELLQCGWNLSMGTAREAEKYLFREK